MPDRPSTPPAPAEALAGAGSRAQARAWAALAGHRWWAYRACAPDPDNPAMAASDPSVPLTVWLTADTETQPARYAREATALALCGRCPLREACLAYALGDSEGPYERRDIWGGMLARERTDLLRRRRLATAVPAPAAGSGAPGQPRPSGRDLAVLQALAAHRTPTAVAAATGLTVTRANWHRSRLVTALNLDPSTATRGRLLHTARLVGLLDPRTPIRADRGLVAAIPSRQAAVARAHARPGRPRGVQLALLRAEDLTIATIPAPLPAAGLPPAGPAGAGGTAAADTRHELAVAA